MRPIRCRCQILARLGEGKARALTMAPPARTGDALISMHCEPKALDNFDVLLLLSRMIADSTAVGTGGVP